MSEGEDVRTRLSSEVLLALWKDLKEHSERGVLFILSTELDLVDVGVAVAEDKADVIATLIGTAKFTRPTAEQIETWNMDQEKSFRALIVAPFVLIQSVGH